MLPVFPVFRARVKRSLAESIRSIGKALGLEGIEDAIEINRFVRAIQGDAASRDTLCLSCLRLRSCLCTRDAVNAHC